MRSIARNPVYITQRALSRGIDEILGRQRIAAGEKWLDVGCGEAPYAHLFSRSVYIGMEVGRGGSASVSKRQNLIYDGREFPIKSGLIDGVICTQVLEHVREPSHLLGEINRALKPGGRLLVTAPLFWEEHEQPYDFFRFTSYGMKELLEGSGFSVVEQIKSAGGMEAISQLLSVHVSRSCGKGIRGWQALVNAVMCAPIQALGYLLQALLPDSGELYLNSIILASKR